VPARREEEDEVESHPGGGGNSGEEPGARQEADQDLRDGDADPGEPWMWQGECPQDEAAGGSVGEGFELGADIGWRPRVQEARIAQLLDARVDEGGTEKQAQGEQRQRWREDGRAMPGRLHQRTVRRPAKPTQNQ
jgi:hypothetical protein